MTTDSPKREMTRAEFARQAAYLASRASSWAGDAITLPEKVSAPMHPDSISRFTAMLRETADMLERWDF